MMDAEWDCSEVRKEEVEQESCADRREEIGEMNRSADPVEEEEAEGWPCCTPWRRRGGFWVVAASFGACLVGLVCGGFGVGAPRPPPREKMKSILLSPNGSPRPSNPANDRISREVQNPEVGS